MRDPHRAKVGDTEFVCDYEMDRPYSANQTAVKIVRCLEFES